MDQKQLPSDRMKIGGAFNIVNVLAQGHATCMGVFLRCGYGPQALGWNGVAALIVQMIYFLIAPSAAMGGFFLAWIGAMVLQRIETGRRYLKGEVGHSMSDGFPWVALKFPFVRSERVARNSVEPTLCLVMGVLLMSLDQALGMFVFCGCFSLLFVRGVRQQVVNARVRAMRDAEIEMQIASDEYRGRR